MMDKIYVIILNYNNWQDTIECMESVLRSDYPNFQVILIDNDSTDNSQEYIKEWLEGNINVWVSPSNKLRNLSFPPIEKPLPYVFYDKKTAEDGGNLKLENSLTYKDSRLRNPIIFIQTGKNLGFSGGNNVGIRYALKKDDFKYIWLLNNDTVVEKNTLTNLVNCANSKDDSYGMFGTTLLYYDEPELVQALGGKFNQLFATGKHKYANQEFEKVRLSNDIQDFDYIIGASLLLTNKFIKEVGLLSEDYFIYYEEIDLALRGKKKGFKMHICLDSIVYHKESVTIKKSEQTISSFSDYYRVKNRIKLTKKHNPKYLPIIYTGMIFSVYKRIKRKQYEQAKNVLKIMFGLI